MKIRWLEAPEEHDYPSAREYLSLTQENYDHLVSALACAPMTSYKAKDIFRASRLSLLGISNKHVANNLRKIQEGKKLSPLLLVRGPGRVIIADGYHRLCAVYQVDEDANIPCKIV